MAISVNVINALVGPSHVLSEVGVSNWVDIIGLVTTTPCDFEIHYNGDVLTGSIAKSGDGLSLLVGFNDPNTALPGGMCLLVDCNTSEPVIDGCVPNRVTEIDMSTRFMMVDDQGCPVGYVWLNDIFDFIASELDIPRTLCDLIPDGIPTGNLVAGDRILTTTGDPACTLKSVPQNDVVC